MYHRYSNEKGTFKFLGLKATSSFPDVRQNWSSIVLCEPDQSTQPENKKVWFRFDLIWLWLHLISYENLQAPESKQNIHKDILSLVT